MKNVKSIGNYATVAELLRILEEHKASPENAEVVVETYSDPDSYGGYRATSEVYLVFNTKD
jgi:hypothetical protein